MKKVIITGLVIIAALAGIIYTLNGNKAKNKAETDTVAQQNAAVAVRTETVEVKELNTQYITNGIIIPKQEVMLSAETSGRITKLLVEEGTLVKVGQTLAIIDGDKQNVTLTNAQAVYNNAQSEYNRFNSAFSTGGVTQQQLEQAKLQLENAKNNLESARISFSDINIKASFTGIVNKRNIEVGSYVSPGQQLFEIVNVSSLKLKVNVDEKNISTVTTGQTVKIEVNVLPNQVFQGKVTFIAPKADSNLNFPIELEIENNSKNELKAGMYATAYIGNEEKATVLAIPRTAFVGSVSSNQVFVVQDGKAVLKTVTSGRSFGDYIEIVSGLEKGMQAITSGQINLLDGMPVEIIN